MAGDHTSSSLTCRDVEGGCISFLCLPLDPAARPVPDLPPGSPLGPCSCVQLRPVAACNFLQLPACVMPVSAITAPAGAGSDADAALMGMAEMCRQAGKQLIDPGRSLVSRYDFYSWLLKGLDNELACVES